MSYVCRTCQNSHSLTLENPRFDCPNCAPIDFECTKCHSEKQIQFSHACNACTQGEILECSSCLLSAKKLVICDGCLYPVCSEHSEEMEAFDFDKNEKVFFHFCNAFEDPHLCFEAFRRLHVNDVALNNVYFSHLWITKTLPELCVTQKWAKRQEKIKSKGVF